MLLQISIKNLCFSLLLAFSAIAQAGTPKNSPKVPRAQQCVIHKTPHSNSPSPSKRNPSSLLISSAPPLVNRSPSPEPPKIDLPTIVIEKFSTSPADFIENSSENNEHEREKIRAAINLINPRYKKELLKLFEHNEEILKVYLQPAKKVWGSGQFEDFADLADEYVEKFFKSEDFTSIESSGIASTLMNISRLPTAGLEGFTDAINMLMQIKFHLDTKSGIEKGMLEIWYYQPLRIMAAWMYLEALYRTSEEAKTPRVGRTQSFLRRSK